MLNNALPPVLCMNGKDANKTLSEDKCFISIYVGNTASILLYIENEQGNVLTILCNTLKPHIKEVHRDT